jgi:hypothetical protein
MSHPFGHPHVFSDLELGINLGFFQAGCKEIICNARHCKIVKLMTKDKPVFPLAMKEH